MIGVFFTFSNNLIKKRVFGPVVWNLILQSTILNAFTFFINADLLSPVQWFYQWYVDFIWRGYFLYIIPLTFIVVTQGCVCMDDYVQTQPFYATRWSLIQQVLTVHNIILGLLHLTSGFLIPWIYSSLVGGQYLSFIYECYGQSGAMCFSEKKFFLVTGGMAVNLIYFLQNYFLGTRYLSFPVTPLPKFILIKGLLLQTIQDTMKWVLFPCISFFLMYYLRGGLVRNVICYIFSLNLESQQSDTLAGLMDVKLLFYLFLFSSIVIASMRMMELFFKVSLTERHKFSFYAVHNDSLTLCEALQRSDCPIIQHLAYLDLMMLTEHSKARREDIFKLSDFGGHPHLWNSIKKECLTTIQEFTDGLEANLKLPTQPKEPPEPPRPKDIKRNVTNYFVVERALKILESSSTQEGLATSPAAPPTFILKLSDAQKARINNIPLVMYFFGDRKDMRIRRTFSQYHIVIWACEALSFLVCHSIVEDSYGILVSDIPQILMNLLRLKWILDTLLRQSILASSLGRQDVLNTMKGTAMKKSVKRSIYRIVNTFKDYISDLQLTEETEAQLLPYLTYRE